MKEKKKDKERERERSREKESDNSKNNLHNNNNKFNGKKILNNKKNEICKFYQKGWCKNGENCNYIHIPNPCRYYNALGKCTNKNCK